MTCPSDEQLAQLAYGRLHGEALGELEQHLDGCTSCRKLLAAVSNGSAPLTQPERAALSPGERLGRYEIERLIAAGGMGMLYVARDTQLARRVALKLMRPAFGGDVGRMRLLREAQAMAALSHPNVLQVFELGEVDGRVFVAMELVDGGTLRDFMKRPSSTWREMVAMFVAAGQGLSAAHQSGVIHRDFKPENVLVGKDGRPRVGDFGLSRPGIIAEEEPPRSLPMKVTHTGTMLGTPAYMSPEQLQGKPADARSDQYGFCVCLYEALAGKRPFPADTLEELRARVIGGMPPPPKDGLIPAHVWAAISRGLQPDPAQRFPDMEALLTVLAFDEKPARAKRASLGTIAAAILGLGTFGGLVTWLGERERQQPAPPVLPAVSRPAVVTPPLPVKAEAPPARPEVVFDPLPAGAVPPTDFPQTFGLGLHLQRVLRLPQIQRIAVGDASIADIKTIGEDAILVLGAGLGKTTLLVWTADGRRHESTVDVTERGPSRPVDGTLDLEPGLTRVIDLPRIVRVMIGDDQIADVKLIGDDQAVVVAGKPGRTDIVLWTADRELHTFVVNVKRQGARPAASAGPFDSDLELGVGTQKVLDLPGIQRVAVGDSAVADVKTIGNDQLLVIGAAVGRTTLLVWTADGKRSTYLIGVKRN